MENASMLAAYARNQYEEVQVQTTPGRLVVMLYDGALRFLHLGLDALRRADLEAQSLNLGKAESILCELIATLDMGAGDLSQGLLSIYTYCIERLLRANAEDRADYVEEVIRLLASLRDAWDHAERSIHAEAAGAFAALAPALAGAAR
jgi:flagellar secretion chaperone FliS